jgi:hypothetical protein
MSDSNRAILNIVLGIVIVVSALITINHQIFKARINSALKHPTVAVHEGCEYLIYRMPGESALGVAHKGNCTNHIRPRAIIEFIKAKSVSIHPAPYWLMK